MADNDNKRHWLVDCDGKGQEWVVRDGGDSRVVMMAVVAEDGGSRQRWQMRAATAAEDNSMQDWVADYEGDGQERVARDGGDMEWR